MFANIIVQFFLKGGPVMWPILLSAVIAVAVVGERIFWWLRESSRRDPKKLEQVLGALEANDVPAAIQIADGSKDPVIRMIHRGLNHARTSLEGALQLAAGIELERAGRFLTVMDTLVTLAPLLGLLGTVTGLMRAFLSIGNAELSVVSVTGGIGEALIATACGLGIAIVSLIPFNYFTGRLTRLQFELEAAATNVEIMVHHPEQHHDSAVKIEPRARPGAPVEPGSQPMKLSSPVKRRHTRIEIIPLIDIMFFLLASFMMVSLQLDRSQNIKVNLPSATQARADYKPDMINIAVDKAGAVFFEKKPITLPALAQMLSNRFRLDTNLPVYLSGDAATLHGAMVDVLETVRRAGVQKVAFMVAGATNQANP